MFAFLIATLIAGGMVAKLGHAAPLAAVAAGAKVARHDRFRYRKGENAMTPLCYGKPTFFKKRTELGAVMWRLADHNKKLRRLLKRGYLLTVSEGRFVMKMARPIDRLREKFLREEDAASKMLEKLRQNGATAAEIQEAQRGIKKVCAKHQDEMVDHVEPLIEFLRDFPESRVVRCARS